MNVTQIRHHRLDEVTRLEREVQNRRAIERDLPLLRESPRPKRRFNLMILGVLVASVIAMPIALILFVGTLVLLLD